jgi:hypothetical protein
MHILATQLPPAMAQRRSVNAAQAHAAKLMLQLHNDHRFTNVCVHVEIDDTKGTLLLHGTVATEEAATSVRTMITASQPPVAVVDKLEITPRER